MTCLLSVGVVEVSTLPVAHAEPPVQSAPSTQTRELELEEPSNTDRGSWLIPTLHGLSVMALVRLDEALILQDEYANFHPDFMWHNLKEAFSKPPVFDPKQPIFRWDHDDWPTNIIGHGLFGSELYMRTRTCQKTILEGFAFTTVAVGVWEYGFEATASRPSAQDLVYTPIMGTILGELRYQGWRAAARSNPSTSRTILMAVLDPLGELERAAGTKC